MEAIGDRSIAICVDTQAALKPLNSNSLRFAEVKDYLNSLNVRDMTNSVELIWVQGHSDI